ncbi:PepSY domain-containing protein [Microvirga puerhi]|uniref:PepSY domain-containing protein n=1 Tax=Microvirga puerhi TaxID=2876078 RepID=A0ABS7VTH7_9HYPH|nr:PepSY domain-containing protein [Microvirga puerhi]MBZ6078873.1 PepSY domain-containing protein [Microvirga puerhi]
MSYPTNLFAVLISFGVVLGSSLGAAEAATATAAKPKITSAQARDIALKAYPGRILKEELEQEGNGLRYSFDISRGSGKPTEVSIDAMDGHVLEAPSGTR